jgi:hypothetical protein
VGNDNDTGQLFSMTQGFANTSGVTWTGTLNPTITQVNTYAQGGSTTVLGAGQTVTPSAPVVTVTGTAVTYTTRNVVSGNTTTVYRTPVTTTTYSDGTSTNANGTETLYQTRVASNVVTNKITNGVLTVTTTPIAKVTTSGVTTVESNGNVTSTTQNVLQGLNAQVFRYDPKNYNCFIGICSWNFTYHTPSTDRNSYGNPVNSYRTTNGMFFSTNSNLPNNDTSLLGRNDGTVVRFTGTITAPTTTANPAGTVYRLYFYNNSDDGFKMTINGNTIINQNTTVQLQSVFGTTSNGYMDVVAGQTYNIEAWYWNTYGGLGHTLYWDYGNGRTAIPNSAFSTGWITETNTIDTTGVSYSNSSVVDITGTSVSMYPDYVTIGAGTPGEMVFGTGSNITTEQQTKVDTWTNKTITDGNKIYIDQVGDNNLLTVLQEGNKNLVKGIGVDRAKIDGDSNNITIRQGVSGSGQNEINFSVIGDTNTLNINQARDTQGTAVGGNGHYQIVDINGYSNTLTTQQSNVGGVGGHYMETTISGNSNNIVSKQTENGNKIMFTNVSGNSNTIDARQKDTGQHYLDIKMSGNNNNATVLQEGTAANRATLDLTNAGGPANVTVQQNGGQSVSVTTTCATAGGCAPITVRQGY